MKKIFLFLQFLSFLLCIRSECLNNIETRVDEIFVYSTESSTYNDAESQCHELGGSLAQITEQDRNLFFSVLSDLCLQGLVEVKIYNKTTEHLNGDVSTDYDYHKYRADECSVDDEELDDYDRPGIGDLSSIWLSSSSQSDDTSKVQFCFVELRDLIMRECDRVGGWNLNFDLYEETNQSNNTIMLYNYYANFQGATSKFSLNEIIGSYWSNKYTDGISSIYLKDISVFIGAQSNVNQTKWYWNNNTEVKSQGFPQANSSLCQQMTWPLTYNDGINLRPKQCETGMSYYVCQVLFSINVDEVVCNATSLNVSWNSLSQLFQDSSNLVGDLQISFQAMPRFTIMEITLDQTNVIVDGLNQRTNYELEVNLQIKNCPTFNLTSSSSGRTGYGVPDPVESAYVNNTYNQCKIIWKHNTTHTQIQGYQIHIETDSGNTSFIPHNATNDVELQIFKVDLNHFNCNTTLNFSILAISTCELQSMIQPVNGTCTTPSPPTTANDSSNELLIGIGVGVGVLIILIVLLLVYIFRIKKIKSLLKETDGCERNSHIDPVELVMQDNPLYDSYQFKTYENNEVEQSNEDVKQTITKVQNSNDYEDINLSTYLIPRKDLEKLFTDECSNGFKNLLHQFEEIKKLASKNESKHDLATANKDLNRLRNVYSYDHALVPLTGNKYINASFIQGFENPKQYIATQGPKPNTISDFWDMVWIQESHIIVMLCKCKEKNKNKCEAYWPLPETPKIFENLIVVLKRVITIGDITKRIFALSNTKIKEERTVVQYQYTGFLDHDVPCTTSSMTKLRHLVNKEHSAIESRGPIVVHCSAGAGRTGIYIAIDNLINEINQTQHIDVFNAVLKMRRNRKDMVQKVSQYIFIHKVVAESLILQATEIDVGEFPDTIQNKSSIDKQSSKEFALFSNPVLMPPEADESSQPDAECDYANVKLTFRKDEHQVAVFVDQKRTMMDAHFIQIPCLSSTTIVAAEPDSKNESLFWNMILLKNVRCVVGLEESYLTSKLKKEGEVVSFKQTKVIVESVEETSSLLHSNITIHSDKISHHLEHITLKEIEKEKFVNVKSCLEVYEKIKLISDSCLMIYCKDGCRISGLFLTLMMSIEQIKAEDKIDLFRTVKDLKDYRPSLVCNKSTYKACYKLVDEFYKRHWNKEN